MVNWDLKNATYSESPSSREFLAIRNNVNRDTDWNIGRYHGWVCNQRK
jgi:hypothetical protein